MGSYSVLLLFISAVLSYSLVSASSYFPYAGFALSGFVIPSIIYFNKEKKSLSSTLFYSFTVLLSICLLFRSNMFLSFLNLLGIMFFTSELILDGQSKQTLENTLFSPLVIAIRSFVTKISPPTIKIKKVSFEKYIPSIILSILALAIIIPLLASANPIFDNLVTRFINISSFLNTIIERANIHIARFILFVIFAFFIPRFVILANKITDRSTQVYTSIFDTIIFSLPKIITIVILSVFFVTQIQLYLASDDVLLELGYTNSEYAREVFGQLSVVTIVAFLLIYADKVRTKVSQSSTYILLVQLIFLNSIALKSVSDYTYNWGFTFKRLYGYTVVLWLFAVIAVYTFFYIKRKNNEVFLRSVLILTGVTLLLVNFLNFDKLIYYKSKSITHHGLDYEYLSRLPSDSESSLELVKYIKENKEIGSKVNEQKEALYRIYRNLETIEAEYEALNLRTFNVSRYKEYQRIKNYNLEEINEFADELQIQEDLRISTITNNRTITPGSTWSRYTNHAIGFSLEFPSTWQISRDLQYYEYNSSWKIIFNHPNDKNHTIEVSLFKNDENKVASDLLEGYLVYSATDTALNTNREIIKINGKEAVLDTVNRVRKSIIIPDGNIIFVVTLQNSNFYYEDADNILNSYFYHMAESIRKES